MIEGTAADTARVSYAVSARSAVSALKIANAVSVLKIVANAVSALKIANAMSVLRIVVSDQFASFLRSTRGCRRHYTKQHRMLKSFARMSGTSSDKRRTYSLLVICRI